MDSTVFKILLNKLYRLLSVRARSEKEIRNYFRIKNSELRIKGKEQLGEDLIDQLIEKLKEQRLIDDLEFAKAWVESRSRKKGLRVIKQELFQKGIDKEIIEDVIRLQVTGYSEQQTAQNLLEKKMRIWKNLPDLEFKKKAYEFLMRRGFEYDIVGEAIEKFLQKK